MRKLNTQQKDKAMDFETIYEAITNGEITLSATDITNLVVAATTKDDVINCDTLQEVITGLQGVKKTAKEEFAAMKKEMDNASKAELAARAMAYVATLKPGSPISWVKADGSVMTGTLGEQKKGAKTAHVILDEIPANTSAKNPKPDRYAKFHSIVVPEDFEMPVKEEVVA